MTKNHAPPSQDKSVAVAIILNVIITGAGHIYVGDNQRGWRLIAIYLVLWILTIATGVAGLIFFPYWVWGIVNVADQARKVNSELEEKTSKILEKERSTISSIDFVTKVKKLSKLHSAGLLNEDEFSGKKKAVIETLITHKTREDEEDFLEALIPLVEKKYLCDTEVTLIKDLIL